MGSVVREQVAAALKRIPDPWTRSYQRDGIALNDSHFIGRAQLRFWGLQCRAMRHQIGLFDFVWRVRHDMRKP